MRIWEKYLGKLNLLILEVVNALLILKQELNTLLIVCSIELVLKIEELNNLTIDFNKEMQKSLSMISTHGSNAIVKQFETLGYNERWLRFESLNKEIIILMRKEMEII
jgi:hypothetical protein